MGMESIDKGSFEVGETVKVGYADQTHKDIDPKKTVYQVVSGGQEFIRVGGKEVNSRAYLSKFNFAGADQEKLCGVLSGGERNRLHLALTLKAEATSPVVRSSFLTTVGSSTVSVRISFRSKGIQMSCSTKVPIRSMKSTSANYWATWNQNVSVTVNLLLINRINN